MWFKHIKTSISLVFLLLFCNAAASVASEIEWRLFVKPYADSNPVLTRKTRVGEEFVIRESDLRDVPSSSRDIVGALDGTSFLIQQLPTDKPVTIHVILNVSGNAFEPVRGIPLFLNISFEAFVGGERRDDLKFGRSPMLLTIPQNGLNTLLSLCGVSRENLVCAYDSGGTFTDDGIETKDVTSRMTVKLYRLEHTVGGVGKDMGIEAKVKYDTWSKIKLLFR